MKMVKFMRMQFVLNWELPYYLAVFGCMMLTVTETLLLLAQPHHQPTSPYVFMNAHKQKRHETGK